MKYRFGSLDKYYDYRINKALKIRKVLNKFKDLKNCKILDIGTGSGIIAYDIGKVSKKVYSVDLEDKRIYSKNYIFKKVKDEILPFKDNYFDIVISNHVIEHVKDYELHLSEAKRVLIKDGIFYLATPNKYWIIEPHYKLPFLSILPRKLANLFVRLKSKSFFNVYPYCYLDKNYYKENLFGYYKLFKTTKKYFNVKDYSVEHLKDNKFYFLYKIFDFFFYYFLPSFIFILTKDP